MARKREASEPAKLEMTPMIDVVFQLLIFFIVTIKQEDILSKLDVIRPAPDPEAKPEEQVQDLLQITVYKDGYVLRGTPITPAQLRRQLKRLAGYSKNISVIVRCTADSPHKLLVELLDMCAEAELSKIAVFSM
ncbi:MAG: ExbD/TolR family protein [Kiritimatiellia bacterium]